MNKEQQIIIKPNPHYVKNATHNYDDEGICTKCGFDGAEWHYWKVHTYEGKASNLKQPECK